MIIHLTRYESTSNGTFGKLVVGDHTYDTIERPWLDNKKEVSCIPPGLYTLVSHKRPNGDNVYALVNEEKGITHYQEPNSKRYLILIHIGNYLDDIIGCIAPGMHRSGNTVSQSRKAMEKIMNALPYGEEHKIMIVFDEV